MIRLTATNLAIFIAFQLVAIVVSQPIPLTKWEKISYSQVDPSEPPRVATFSDGGYVVVYTLSSPTNEAVGSIFGPDGVILVEEFALPDISTACAVPRVIVFSDDTFMTVWRDLSTNDIQAKLWYRNATAITTQSRVSLTAVPPSANFNALEIARMPNDSWCMAYIGIAYINIQWFENKGSWTTNGYSFPAAPDARLALAVSFIENQIYLFHQGSYEQTLAAYRISPATSGYSNYIPIFDGPTPLNPYAVAMSSGIVATLWQSDLDGGSIPSSIGLTAVMPGLVIFSNYTVVNDNLESDGAYNPVAIDLGNDKLLVAYEGTFMNRTRLIYRMLYVSPTNPVARSAPLGPEVFDDEEIRNVYMASLLNSNVVVVATNISDEGIIRRVLTFCGNGAIDLSEECDGTEFCGQTCRCEPGTIGIKGLCKPECGDGLVMGSEQCDSSPDNSCDNTNCVCAPGFIPISPRRNTCVQTPSSFVPSVGPTLDCIASGNVPVAHFSFVNEDGFPQNIPQGDLNRFIPDTLGDDRPTQFGSGASLTYPAAPYRLDLPSDLQSFTWFLGQFNLTVDLTNITALFCPRDVSFIVRLLTSDLLTNEIVQIFLNNFARRYAIAEWRLTAIVVLNNPGPAEKRSVQQAVAYNDYSVTVTVAAANTSEASSAQVVSDFLTEYKNETRQSEIQEDLTQGLESVNPQIKEVTPAPTGVSVRSNKYEAAPVAPMTPVTPVSTPVNISSGTKIFCSVLFGVVLALVL